MASPYHFRPMTTADLPLIKRWLAQPHVREWWGDPAEQYALVSGDLDEPAMDQFIVAANGNDFGYIQCYDLTAWNCGLGAQPDGTRGIDLFIGAPDMVPCNLAKAMMEPEKVIAPIATPMDISIRLAVLIAPDASTMAKATGDKKAAQATNTAAIPTSE